MTTPPWGQRYVCIGMSNYFYEYPNDFSHDRLFCQPVLQETAGSRGASSVKVRSICLPFAVGATSCARQPTPVHEHVRNVSYSSHAARS